MEFLTKLTIKSRLTFGFGLVLVLIVLLTAIGIVDVNSIDRKLTEITDINSVKQRYAINYRGSVHDTAIAIRDIAIADNARQISEFEREIDELAAFYQESKTNMRRMIDSGVAFSNKERDIINRIVAIEEKAAPLVDTILSNKKPGKM